MKYCTTAILALILTACGGHPVTVFTKEAFPEKLSDWGVVYTTAGELRIHEEALPYDLNTPLFTDYAHKLRTVWIPDGATGYYDADTDIRLPVGSIITKTFYYPVAEGRLVSHPGNDDEFTTHGLDLAHVQLMETRVLVHLEDGWHGLPYVWNEAQQDATLELTGAIRSITLDDRTFDYVVPDFNQCQECHVENLTTRDMKPLGIRARHLNKPYRHHQSSANQLDDWRQRGFVSNLPDASTLPRNAGWDNEEEELEKRARSYLDINCGHCHNPAGAADTSGLFLQMSATDPLHLGICKPPVAAGQGTGGRKYSITPGAADDSILPFRMTSLDPGAMMPELGRSLIHTEGIGLIAQWINEMQGDCDTP